MKKVFAISILVVFLASCNSSKPVANYLTKHNFKESHTYNPATNKGKIHASIDSLYNYQKVEEYCDTVDVTFHIAKAGITFDATCDGAVEKLNDLVKKVYSLIESWKK